MQENKKQWISLALFILVGLLYLVLKFQYHELWKDEWQPWLLARDKGLFDMLGFLHNEGHPALWFCYLKPWAVISNALELGPDGQVTLFSIAHSLLFLSSLFLLLFRFKMPLWLRGAIVTGFFFFYEYGIVNRGYILLIFLSFYLLSVLNKKGKASLAVSILLFLICQTEVYGVFIAIGIFCAFYWDYFQKTKDFNCWNDLAMRRNGLGVLAGFVVFVLTVFPREGQEVIGLNTSEALLTNIGHGIQGNLSNTFLIGLIPDTNVFGVSVIGLLLAGVVLAGLFFLFYKDKAILIALVVYLFAVIAFDSYVYQGGVRHWGINFIFLIVLLEYYHQRHTSLNSWQTTLLGVFLLCQFYYNAKAIQKEIKHPFSNAKQAAAFILEKIPENVPIVAFNQFETAPVVAYTGRTVHAFPEGEPFTFYQWLDKVYLPSEQELRLFTKYKNKSGVVIISPRQLGKERYPNVELWQAFDGFNLKGEFYFVYLLSLK